MTEPRLTVAATVIGKKKFSYQQAKIPHQFIGADTKDRSCFYQSLVPALLCSLDSAKWQYHKGVDRRKSSNLILGDKDLILGDKDRGLTVKDLKSCLNDTFDRKWLTGLPKESKIRVAAETSAGPGMK